MNYSSLLMKENRKTMEMFRLMKKFLRFIDQRGFKYIFYYLDNHFIKRNLYNFKKLYSANKVKKLSNLILIFSLLLIFLFLYFIQASKMIIYVFLFLGMAFLFIKLLILPKIYFQIKLRRARELSKSNNKKFTEWKVWLANSPDLIDQISILLKEKEEVILGSIDNDGRVLGLLGDLPNWTPVAQEYFLPRYHYPLDIVINKDFVLVRKNFQGDKNNFLNEWITLEMLCEKANVPHVYKVLEQETILYKNLVNSVTLRDKLVRVGAKILNKQTDNDNDLKSLTSEERHNLILSRGTKELGKCVDSQFINNLFEQIRFIHKTGITHLSLSFGNVMVDQENNPWLIDFENSISFHSTRNIFFQFERDLDITKFNKIYNQNEKTLSTINSDINFLNNVEACKYAPIDFGSGFSIGDIWSVDSGTGRWEYFNRKYLTNLIQDKKILDLGSNNGVMPMMMLRDGVKSVTGLERDGSMIENTRRIQRIFEWHDMQKYDLTIFEEDMRAILEKDIGKFDIVTAFCSLYYLSEEDMARVVRRVAQLAPIMILQAKTDTRSEAGDNKAKKSSLLFLQQLLEENGFPTVFIHNQPNYSRPILVGSKED